MNANMLNEITQMKRDNRGNKNRLFFGAQANNEKGYVIFKSDTKTGAIEEAKTMGIEEKFVVRG